MGRRDKRVRTRKRLMQRLERADSTLRRASLLGDQDNPLGPPHHRMRPFERDLIRERHTGQQSCEPHCKAGLGTLGHG